MKTSSYSTRYSSNNKEYTIELFKESNGILLKCYESDNINIIPLDYSGKFNLDELKENNKFSRIYDSIEELSEFFNQIINQKKAINFKRIKWLKNQLVIY